MMKEEEEEGVSFPPLFKKKKRRRRRKRKSLDSVYLRLLTPSSSRSVPAAGTNSHVLLSIQRRARAGN